MHVRRGKEIPVGSGIDKTFFFALQRGCACGPKLPQNSTWGLRCLYSPPNPQKNATFWSYNYVPLKYSSGIWSVKENVLSMLECTGTSIPLLNRFSSNSQNTNLHRPLDEKTAVGFLFLISQFPSAPGISCRGAADCFTSYLQAALRL